MLSRASSTVALCFMIIALWPVYAHSELIAITQATIIDGTGNKAIKKGVLLIQDDRIVAVGKSKDIAIPDNARRIDARGKYVIPGLMDANLHLYLQIDLESLVRYEGRYHDIIIEAAQIALKTGQTTVFDTWGPRAPLVQAQAMINQGEVPGSRIFLAGNIVGYGGPLSSDFGGPGAAYGGDAARYASQSFVKRTNALWAENTGQHLMQMGPEEVRKEIRQYISKGVDFLKYGASGHAQLDMRFIAFSPRVQRVIVEEAHRAGITVQAHTSSIESLDMAVNAGVDILTHCGVMGLTMPIRTILDDTIKKMAERQIPCSILPITQRRLDALIEKAPGVAIFQNINANHHKLIKAGVPLLLSTDSSTPNSILGAGDIDIDSRTTLGEGHFNGLKALQDMGMEPMEILKSATSNIAKAYKKDRDLGTLEKGKIADLVILNKNPLKNAENYRSIYKVIKEGREVDLDALPVMAIVSVKNEK